MTESRRIRWLIITAAALFSVTAGAQTRCPPTPEKYADVEFGGARFALEEGCRETFTQDEQFFFAGIAQRLRSSCKLPRDREGRARVEQLIRAAELSLDLWKRKGLHGGVPSQPDRTSAFAAGISMTDDIRCNAPEAALLARGLVIYLKRNAATSRFLAGCVEFYAPRYGAKECRCIADALRPRLSDIDERFFDRELIKAGIHDSPRIVVTLMLSCGVPEY